MMLRGESEFTPVSLKCESGHSKGLRKSFAESEAA
jgi:hypothetical protein